MAFFGFFGFSSVSCVLGILSFASLPFAHKTWVPLVCLLLSRLLDVVQWVHYL